MLIVEGARPIRRLDARWWSSGRLLILSESPSLHITKGLDDGCSIQHRCLNNIGLVLDRALREDRSLFLRYLKD